MFTLCLIRRGKRQFFNHDFVSLCDPRCFTLSEALKEDVNNPCEAFSGTIDSDKAGEEDTKEVRVEQSVMVAAIKNLAPVTEKIKCLTPLS